MLRDERAAFVDYLPTLSPEGWDRPSLCPGWRVRDVVAHIVAGAKSTPRSFVVGMISAGFRFERMTERQLRREVRARPAELIDRLESLVSVKTLPPLAMLGEIVVHGEDVRQALGSTGRHPTEHLVAISDYYKKAGPPIRAKKRIGGLRLEATDVEWSTGDGPLVTGPMLPLLLAMTGRHAGIAALSGPGLEVLSSR